MSNYFIKSDQFENEELVKLAGASILLTEMEIDGFMGLIFEAERIMEVLDLLNCDLINLEETSIPGIVMGDLCTLHAGSEREFTLPETAEPARRLTATIITPRGVGCDHWRSLLRSLKAWVEYPGSISGVDQVFIHEAYVCDEVFPPRGEGELHIIVGRQPAAGADNVVFKNNLAYIPAGRLIWFANLPACPGDEHHQFIVNSLSQYLPEVLAPTAAAAELAAVRVVIGYWNGGMDKGLVIAAAQEILLPVINQEIIIDVPHGRSQKPLADGAFHIWIWSGVNEYKSLLPPPKMWGLNVACRDHSFSSSGQGPTITDDQGEEVGELVGDNLYIFHDACHYNTTEGGQILRRIMTAAAEIIKLPAEEKAALARQPRVYLAFNADDNSRIVNIIKIFKTITTETLLPLLKRPVFIHCSGNQPDQPLADGAFHIWIWSSLRGGSADGQKMPAELFGQPTNTDNGWRCFAPAGQGLAIIDIMSGYQPAELVDDNLYIHIPLHNPGMVSGQQIYRAILELVALELSGTEEDRVRYRQNMAEARRRRDLENFTQICQRGARQTIEKSRKELANISARIAEEQKNLVTNIRRESDLRRQLAGYEQHNFNDRAKFEAEYHNLAALDGVEKIETRNEVLLVYTGPIYITTNVDGEGEVTFDIGKFRIEIYFDGDCGGILFFNQIRQVDGFQHPHIKFDGAPCLGNIKEMVAQLIAEYQFSSIIVLALQYLESLNWNDGWGRNIVKWPRVAKVETVTTAPKGD